MRVTAAGRVLGYVWRHPANRGRRLRGVTRAVAFQARGRLGLRTLAPLGRRGRLWVELHSHAASKVVYANPPDWPEMQAWRRLLRPGDLFVDVGSNVGAYAVWAADAGAAVIAVEPSPGTAARLRDNVRLNQFAIEVRQCAVADRPGRARLSAGRGPVNHLLIGPAPDGDEVAVDTLDRILGDRYAAGVKVDVEGAERLVLQGARRALAQHRIAVLQLEWNRASQHLLGEGREPVAAILAGHGYTLARPDDRGRLRPVTAPATSDHDIFAVAPGRADLLNPGKTGVK
jgi:FkbM family methyltransferase